ncbi:MAG: hypothetical protein MUO23_09020, partial [Anaerolineales bacterium]|nr:hypothetical protein [Anaerolineales bacterium]
SIAWLTTALFVTQPLLFGYAFVNQKDTPFMAAFVIILAAGLAVGDRLAARQPATASTHAFRQGLSAEWRALRPGARAALLGYLALAVLALLDQAVFRWSLGWVGSWMVGAYEGRAGPVVSWLFSGAAAHPAGIPVEAYLSKLEVNLRLAAVPVLLGMIGGAVLLLRAEFPLSLRRWTARNAVWVLPAIVGAFVGFAVSIRPIGAFAGALVSLFWILRLKRCSLTPLLASWAAAATTAYLTWPYLWANPLRNFWASLQLTGTFPAHDMLYRGVTISSDALPWHFFPTLAGIQLTEPVFPLVVLGVGALLWRLRKRSLPWREALVIGLWFLVPMFGLLFMGFGIYGNIRQLLFVLPPLFLLAGLGLQVVLQALPWVWARRALAALVILPGVVGIVRMHPYEHAYFNLYAGGVDGAWGQYQPSHWCTSLREAGEYVNAAAAPGAVVLVDGPVEGVRAFARPDLVVEGVWTGLADPAFIVTCTRTPDEMQAIAGMHKVYEVRRGAAVYAEIFQSNAQ